MKKIWCFLPACTFIFINSSTTACIAKFELTELFYANKIVDVNTSEVNHLVNMGLINNDNKYEIDFTTINFDNVLSFFLKEGQNLNNYFILAKKPPCVANQDSNPRKAIYVEYDLKKQSTDNLLLIDFHLVIYCVWKKDKRVYIWKKTTLTKKIMLQIKSDQNLTFKEK